MLAKFSVKKPYTVVVAILLVIVLGVISFMNMTTDLLPSMDLPYIIVYTTYTGATPEKVESDVSRPLEAAFFTLTDIKNVSSTSSENLSLVVMEFEAGADMNTAMLEINSDIEMISGGWDDAIGTPVIMKLNPDMLPVTVSTVSMDDADLLELSDYVEDELVSAYEAVDGVAQVTASGILTQQVDITIEQNRIDSLNNAILREVDDELADVEMELRNGMSQLSSAKSQISRMRQSVFAQIDEALAAIDAGTQQMPAAIAALTAQRTELDAQLTGAKAMLEQLEALVNLSDEEKAQLELVAGRLSELEALRADKQAQLDALEGGSSDALLVQLEAAQSARAEQAALKASQEKYIEDLKLLDADALEETIERLEAEIAANETTIGDVRGQLETAITGRDAAQREVTELEARIAALEAATATATPAPTAVPTAAPAPDNTATAEPTMEIAEDVPAGSATTNAPAQTGGTDTAAPGETASGSTDAPAETNTAAPAETASGSTDAPAETDTAAPAETASGSTDAPAETRASEPQQTSASTTDAPQQSEAQEPAAEEPAAQEPAQEQPAAEPAAEQPAAVDTQLSLADRIFGVARAEGESLEELRLKLADAQARLDTLEADVVTLSARHDDLRETLNDQAAALQEAKDSLYLLEEGETAVQSRIDAAQQQIDSCNARIAELDAEIAELTAAIEQGGLREQLTAEIAALDAEITAITESDAYKAWAALQDNKALEGQYAQAQAAVAQLETAVAGIDEMLVKLEQGILPGGMIEGIAEDTNLADARLQLEDARAQASYGFSSAAGQINEAEGKLSEAWKEFTDARDEALENAGIDGIITVETISAILGSQNLDLPAGYVANADDRYLVSIGTEFASLAELKQVKLFSLGMETVDDVRLLDVANVEINDNSADLFTLVNGENGVMLSFEKQSTASTAEVAENITAKSDELMAENPRLHVTEMMNQGDYINLIVDSVLDNMISGGALAILVLLLFLLDWRPTLIVALSIPTSVVVAFVCMYFTGITLNVMSLSGLAMGVGMLVDNSIVSIENIYRLRDEEGLPILTASIRGVNQVAGALFASTLTTICVFLPVVFVEGMARDLFTDMGLTIAFSLLASLVVAMTVVPSLSATLFKKSKPRKQRFFKWLQRAYTRMLRGALRVKWLVLLAAVAVLVFSVMQVADMPISFMPSVNSEQMSASLSFSDTELPESEREAIAVEIMNCMINTPGVNDVSLTSGGSLSMTASADGSSYSYYILADMESGRTNAQIAADISADAARWANGETVVFNVQQSTMDLSAFAGQGITVNINGDDLDALRTTAKEVAALCAQVPGAEDIDDGAGSTEPKMIVTVDKELASDNSLSVAQVYQYVAQRLYGAVELTSATLDGREYTLYVSEDKNIDLSPEDVENMEIEVVGTDNTKYVRIGDIASVSYGESFSSISRDRQKRVTSVNFAIAEGYSANLVSRDLEALLDTYQPPEGCEISLAGENESVMGYMDDLLLMLLIAVIFIFLIMVAQFQSFKSPFIVMFTIPLAFTGGLLALIITKMDLSIIAMVGFLVLSGVVVNNGIVFVDSVNQLRIGGMRKRDAIIETGRIRLRPILMTALTTILGMSTMALAQGMGAEMMQPMAVVVIGGMIYSTLMTLFVVPALYDLFNGEKMKAREIEMMKEAAGMHRDGFDDDEPDAEPLPRRRRGAADELPGADALTERPGPTPGSRPRRSAEDELFGDDDELFGGEDA